LSRLGIAESGLEPGVALEGKIRDHVGALNSETLASEIGVGLPTLQDILEALARPGRDPRTDLQGHLFKQGILKLEDLSAGMELQGTVLNVVDFGVFVDIGLKDSGLVHISQMSHNYVRSPHDIAAVGDSVKVWVMQIDMERRRVSLTMIDPTTTEAPKQSRTPAVAPTANSGERPESRPPVQPARPKPESERSRQPKPPPALSTEKSAGREPLRGFDELKQMWREKKG
jgi:protein Tex